MRTATRQLAAPQPGPVALEVKAGHLDLAVIIDPDAIAATALLAGPKRVVAAATTTTRRGMWRITVPDPPPPRWRRSKPAVTGTRTQIGAPGEIGTGPVTPGLPQLTVTIPAGSSITADTGKPHPPAVQASPDQG